MLISLPYITNIPTLRHQAVEEGFERQLQHAQINQDQLPVNLIVNLCIRLYISVAIRHLRYAKWAKSPKPTVPHHKSRKSSDIAHCNLGRGLISLKAIRYAALTFGK